VLVIEEPKVFLSENFRFLSIQVLFIAPFNTNPQLLRVQKTEAKTKLQ
jgi:hypothetical protein